MWTPRPVTPHLPRMLVVVAHQGDFTTPTDEAGHVREALHLEEGGIRARAAMVRVLGFRSASCEVCDEMAVVFVCSTR